MLKSKPARLEAGDVFTESDAKFVFDGVATTLWSPKGVKASDVERALKPVHAMAQSAIEQTQATQRALEGLQTVVRDTSRAANLMRAHGSPRKATRPSCAAPRRSRGATTALRSSIRPSSRASLRTPTSSSTRRARHERPAPERRYEPAASPRCSIRSRRTLRVEHARDDSLLLAYIAAAIGLVESKCNVQINPADYMVTADELRTSAARWLSGGARASWTLPVNNVREFLVMDSEATDAVDLLRRTSSSGILDPGGNASSYLVGVAGQAMPAAAQLKVWTWASRTRLTSRRPSSRSLRG